MTGGANPPASGRDPRPLFLDGFCGRWGWGSAFRDRGYRVIGFDIDPASGRHADGMTFVCADIRDLDGSWFPRARAFALSPPCQKFSTASNLSLRYGKSRNTEEGMELVREAVRLIDENKPDYWCIENVQGAVKAISDELGPPRLRKHSFFLWGNFPGFLLPSAMPLRKFHSVETRAGRSHERWGYEWHRSPALRAIIPHALADSLAEACLP